MPTNSAPYHCRKCLRTDACGYHGILVFEGYPPPMCRHNDKPGKPCHLEPERMVPVKK
jgi:hypothetical protein